MNISGLSLSSLVLLALLAASLTAAPPLIADCEFIERPAVSSRQFRAGPRREVVVPKANEEPTVDGKAAEAAWRGAAKLDGFTLARAAAIVRATSRSVKGDPGEFLLQEMTPPKGTETLGRVYYTDKSLCFFFECLEPKLGKLRVNTALKNAGRRDSSVWQDDDLEVFISPANDGVTIYQFAVNPAGVFFDGSSRYNPETRRRKVNRSWNCAAKFAAGRTGKAWTVEMTLPLKALFDGRPTGSVWGFNVMRQRTNGLSTSRRSSWPLQFWSETDSSASSEPDKYGVLILGRKPTVEVVGFGVQDVKVGRNDLLLRVRNTGPAAELTCGATLKREGKTVHDLRRALRFPARKTSEQRIPFEVKRPGEWTFSGVVTRDGRLITRRFERFVVPADLVTVRLADSIYHGRDRHAKAVVSINVTPGSLKGMSLVAALTRGKATVRESRLDRLRSGEAVVFLDLKGLPPATYNLRLRLFGPDGKMIAVAVRKLTKEEGPFD